MTRSTDYDPQALLTCINGDMDLARELAVLYVEKEAQLVVELQSAVSAADAAAIQRTCHALKGMLGTVRAEGAATLAAAVEDLARVDALGDIPRVLDDLHKALAPVRTALSNVAHG